jgi:GDP-L-fucose synthase
MKLLITGGNGMLGSAVVAKFREKGIEALSPSSKELNLCEIDSVRSYLQRHLPDTVVHCAAKVGGIKANLEDPISFLSTNIRMDSNLMTASIELDIDNFLYIGSSCMYPKNMTVPMKESDLLQGSLEESNEGYALAKLVGWKMTEVQSQSAGKNWRTLILSNLYGPRDHFANDRSHLLAAVIAKTLTAVELNQPSLEMWGDGLSRREFTFAGDVASYIVKVVPILDKIPTTMNIGSGIDYSVRDYYDMVASLCGYQGEIEPNPNKPTGMARKLMDISLAREHGWEASTTIEQGIMQTIDWYKLNRGDK